MLLCRHHHRLLHEGGYQVEQRRAGVVRFRRPDGRLIRNEEVRAASLSALRSHNLRVGLRIDEETAAASSGGGPFSLDMAVGGLLARAGPSP